MAYYIVILSDIANGVSYKQRSREKYQAILEFHMSSSNIMSEGKNGKWQLRGLDGSLKV